MKYTRKRNPTSQVREKIAQKSEKRVPPAVPFGASQ